MVELHHATEKIAKKLGRSSGDKDSVEKYCRTNYSMILNEYMKMFHEKEIVKTFVKDYRMFTDPSDFTPVKNMLTHYKGLVFEQMRAEKDPIFKALYPTVLHAVSERMEDMMEKLLLIKKQNEN